MTIQEAKANIGKPFKLNWIKGGVCSQFDTIISVDDNGEVHGNFLSAPAEDCRLKEAQPDHLKKLKQ